MSELGADGCLPFRGELRLRPRGQRATKEETCACKVLDQVMQAIPQELILSIWAEVPVRAL